MKIALGMITKDLLTKEPLDQFIENAKKFYHDIDSVVIAYSEKIDENVVKELEKDVKVHLIHIMQSKKLNRKLSDLQVSKKSIEHLIGDVEQPFLGRAPYGTCRNHVIMEAMFQNIDVLIFIDTDVYPEVVIHKKDMQNNPRLYSKKTDIKDVYIQEVDFIGNHLNELRRDEVMITTSDYTGYYIIPPMNFEGMQDLFYGLKKEMAYNYIMNSFDHNCLSLDHGRRHQGFRTDKVLGGNVAIKLKLFKEIVPFFSGTYEVGGNTYLARGEDTVLALQMEDVKDKIFYDVDMKIFHNTYTHFPIVPDIRNDQRIKDRFFYASMGWIGRNPFLNDLKGLNIQKIYQIEHEHLVIGSKAIAEYLDDERFLLLPEAHKTAYEHLESMKKEFEVFKNSWFEFIRRMK